MQLLWHYAAQVQYAPKLTIQSSPPARHAECQILGICSRKEFQRRACCSVPGYKSSGSVKCNFPGFQQGLPGAAIMGEMRMLCDVMLWTGGIMKQCYQALGSIFDHQMTKPELLGVSLRIHLCTIKPIKFTEGAPKSSVKID